MGLLFEIDKMLFVSLGGIKITPGCSEWKPNVFTLGVVWKEERAVLLCVRMIPNEQRPRKVSRDTLVMFMAYVLLQDLLLQEFMFWLKINYQCFQIYLPGALGYRNNEIDAIEGKK